MHDLSHGTHFDWIDLDDMNNLGDTKGGNINAHIYSNRSSSCSVNAAFFAVLMRRRTARAKLIPKYILLFYSAFKGMHTRVHNNYFEIKPGLEFVSLFAVRWKKHCIAFFYLTFYLLVSTFHEWAKVTYVLPLSACNPTDTTKYCVRSC